MAGRKRLDMDVANRITKEETLGSKPARPDTADEAIFRAEVRVQIADIKARGGIVELPASD